MSIPPFSKFLEFALTSGDDSKIFPKDLPPEIHTFSFELTKENVNAYISEMMKIATERATMITYSALEDYHLWLSQYLALQD